MLSAGIVGLPNVGKSTLFNALLKKQVAHTANYPFATIEPNVGVIEVPDERLQPLAQTVETDTIVPAAIEFYDIAGLVRGASEGEGLGNKFLSHIRETALICHVVRLFKDSDITHVDQHPDPVRDIQTIETELILADLGTLGNQKEPKGKASKEDMFRWQTIKHVLKNLDDGVPARKQNLSDEQKQAVKEFGLLSLKPVLYVFNVSESQLLQKTDTIHEIEAVLSKVIASSNSNTSSDIKTPEADYVFLCAKLEQDIIALDSKDQQEYLTQYNLTDTGLDRLVHKAYAELGLVSFLTAGKKEVRAWTIPYNTPAPQAAGTIHSDFEKHFIKAEIVKYDDFISLGGWNSAREQGKTLMAGRNYLVQDGDVIDFKVGV